MKLCGTTFSWKGMQLGVKALEKISGSAYSKFLAQMNFSMQTVGEVLFL